VTDRLSLGGCAVDLCTQDEVLQQVQQTLRDSRLGPLAIGSANLDHVYHFGVGGSHEHSLGASARGQETGRLPGSGNASARTAPSVRWIMLLDGVPLCWRTRALNAGDWPRLAGADLIMPILRLCGRQGHTVGFLGGMPAMHAQLRVVLREQVPDVRVAGFWAPERSSLGDPTRARRLADDIRAAHTEVLVVGLGKPHQEEWIERYGAASGAQVLLAFGAAADFVAGVAPRAPQVFRDHGFEWLYRLALEPRRLGRRYLRQGPVALARLLVASSQVREPTNAGPSRAPSLQRDVDS
jgi:N-acetylglucosaminyldiphosphoundecaprenol N-acetyl-beta-D-mannosaminyltransferase